MVAAPSSLTDLSYEVQELSSLLLNTSSSPSEILTSCRAVESFIHRHNTDQSRHFYTICFPVLLRKVFGYEDFSQPLQIVGPQSAGGWIAETCDYSASALVNLLSPSGALFSSMLAADDQNLVRYVFPAERLPGWIRPILRSDRGLYILSEACPALFKGRLKVDGANGGELFQVQLNIFEYYMFWFAYYAVCIDNSNENKNEIDCIQQKIGVRRVPRSRLEKWTSSLPGLYPSHGRGSTGRLTSRPYLYLVNLYLHHFVPMSGFDPLSASPSPYLHHFLAADRSESSRPEFVVHTFVQFWLVDNDPSPLPLVLCKSLNISFSFDNGCCRYVPPSADHTEAIRTLVNYVNSSLQSSPDELNTSQADLKWRLVSRTDSPISRLLSPSLGSLDLLTPLSQLVQRPLYRFILRAFRYWPVGACVKKLAYILGLWLDYLEPWNNSAAERQTMPVAKEDFYFEAENKMLRDPARSFSRKKKSVTGSGEMPVRRSVDESPASGQYNEQWQVYVLANYPFYTSLVVHFLVFANKFVHIDTEAVLQMTHKVLNVLASSKELLSLLRRVEVSYNNVISGSASYSDNLHKLVPAIREQMQEWENDLSEFEKESEMILSSSQKGAPILQLFNASDNGGHNILKLLILRAEAWIQTSPGEKILSGLQSLETLKVLTIKIFGSLEIGFCDEMVRRYGSDSENVPMMKLSGFGRHTWADVKYKGDWMRRPIGDSEVAWLARLLVRLSDWLNQKLALDNQASTDVKSHDSTNISGPTFAEIIAEDDVSIVDFLTDRKTWTNFLSAILSCLMCYSSSLLRAVQGILRRNGWRVNLRILAAKKVLMYLCTCITIVILTKILKRYSYFLLLT